MAFNDSLIVDDSAKASEDSFLAVIGFFKKANGFLSRKPDPDYGVDLEVELLIDGKHISGWQFPIQIKSQQNLSMVSHGGERFVSHTLLTSRLGYLCKKNPAYGLIILYDDATSVCYFDYVEEIVARITDQRNSEDWKDQDSINVNIPMANILTGEIIKIIHRRFHRRFLNNQQMLIEHGSEFEIPVLFTTAKKTDDEFNTPEKIISFIEKHGVNLFNKQHFLMVDELLSRLSIKQILQSPKVLYTAAITYEMVGKYIDAEYYLNRVFQQIEMYEIEEQHTLKLIRIKVDFAFGRISLEQYCAALDDMLSKATDVITKIYIKARLIYLRMGDRKFNKELFLKKSEEIDSLFKFIQDSSIPDQAKHYYKTFLAGALFTLLTLYFSRGLGLVKIKEKLLHISCTQERAALIELLEPEFKKICDVFNDAINFAISTNDELLKHYILLIQGSSFFQTASIISIMRRNQYEPDFKKASTLYRLLITAYNYFIQSRLLGYAYQVITTAFDINKLMILVFHQPIDGADEADLMERMKIIEKETGGKPYKSQVEHIEESIKESKEDEPAILRGMSDEELEDAANMIVEARGLPIERRSNVLGDLKFMKEAYTVLKGMNFVVLQNLKHTESDETYYKEPIKQILVCTKCGFQTTPSYDFAQSFLEKKARHEHVCL